MGSMLRWLTYLLLLLYSHCPVIKSCLTLFPMDCSKPGSCLPLFPGAGSNSCPLNQWSSFNISFSVAPFSYCLQSYWASGSFPVSGIFTSDGQSIGASPSALVFPMNIQGWFLLELTGLISLQSKGLSRVFSSTTIRKHQFFTSQTSGPTPYMTTGKTTALTIGSFAGKVISLLFNMLSRFVIAFFPRSKCF